jgi:hypothetical protein
MKPVTLKTAGLLMALLFLLIPLAGDVEALTTEELLQLKKAGVSEEVVVYMVESRYDDANKVCKLKEAGYKDQTILAIIKSEVGSAQTASHARGEDKNAGPERVAFRTEGRIKILWHLVYRGEPVVQNKMTVDNVSISIIGDNVLKFEWDDREDLGLLEVFRRRPFHSPFYWEIAGDDTLEPGKEGYPWMLKSATGHHGKPATDNAHFWILYFEPKDAGITDYIRKVSSVK